jgi:hypothetical protein
MIRAIAFPIVVLLASALSAHADTVTERVFDANLMSGLQQPAVLRYRYEMQGQGIEPPFASHIEMDVREVAADGGKSVFFDMFDGANRRHFGPMAAQEQNPLVIVLLQRDVTQMANLTGGAAVYFQQQIRRAFNEPAESGPVEVALGDRKLAGTRLVIRPFRTDPHLDRFPQFKDKAYEFVVAEGVPGGLYQLSSRVPDPKDGHLILEEKVTFQEVKP